MRGDNNYLIYEKSSKKIKTDRKVIYQSLKKYLNNKCIENGSSLEAKIKSFNTITCSSYKPCIKIDDDTFLMPDRALDSEKVNLINYLNVDKISKVNDYQTKIIYKDGSEIIIDCNVRTMRYQLNKCRLYMRKLKE